MFIGTNSVIRNTIYVVVGIASLLATSSFYTSVGVVPPEFFRAHVDDDDVLPPVAAIGGMQDFSLGAPGYHGILSILTYFPPAIKLF